MDISVFTNKAIIPNEKDLEEQLGDKLTLWKEIEVFVREKYPAPKEEWNYPGKKYGWTFRMKDKKRAIIYFLPREKSFKVAFVFSQKAFDQIMNSDINSQIKEELSQTKKYVEGRGISIIATKENFLDIKKLVKIKIAN